MRYLLLSLLLILFYTAGSQTIQIPSFRNLIANGDFRSRDPEQRPLRWITGRGLQTVFISTEQHHGPQKDDLSCKLADSSNTDSVLIRSEKCLASPGTKYRATASVKNKEGISGTLYIEFWNQHGKRMAIQPLTPGNDTGWQDIAVTATAPDSVTHLSLAIATSKEGTGISYWDDVSLVQEHVYNTYLAAGQRELFFDDYRIASLKDVQRIIHPGAKTAPLIVPTEPWEGTSTYIYGTVLNNQPAGSGYRMWYTAYLEEKYYLCYATSKDGIKWVKPKLGVYEMNGSRANNICREGGGTVVYDPYDADTMRRYKLMRFDGSKERFGYGVFFSPDGWNWTAWKNNPVISYGDVSNIAYDTINRIFIATTKQRMLISNTSVTPAKMDRAAFVSVSKDFVHWTAPNAPSSAWALAVEGDYADDQAVRAKGGIEAQVYGMTVYPYEGQYIGFPWLFDIRSYTTGVFAVTGDGPIQPQLAFSRDLANWSRPLREPIIPLGKAGAWDDGTLYTASTMLVNDKEMTVYYGAMNLPHGGSTATQVQTARIARASWRRDGMVSMHNAGDDTGAVVTRPLTVNGNRLYVNAQLQKNGFLQVELLDENDRPIATSKLITGDQLAALVNWERAVTLDKKTIRLRFYVKGGDLYSYWFK